MRAVDDALTVTRWTRYGQDRLYVKTRDGVTVGWQCVRTGALTVEVEALRAPMLAVLAQHPAAPGRQASPTPAGGVEPESPTLSANPDTAAPQPTPTPAVWTDLAANLPGQVLLAEAAALRAAHPWICRIDRLFGRHNDERRKRVGAKGEQMVAARLAKLPDTWRVLHAIVRNESGTDIDHLAIGPAGVFTINSKYHAGKRVWVRGSTIKVTGHNQHYVPEMRSEVKAAVRLLSAACEQPVAVNGVVAIICADFTRKGDDDCDVKVIGRKDLDRWLKRQPADRLTPEQIGAIYDQARRSTTWLPGAR